MKRQFLFAVTAVLAFTIHPVSAQQTLDTATVVEAAERLKPGEFLWVPQAAPAGPLVMMVNVKTQRAVLYRNGVPIGITTVSTGRPGYGTPIGVFTILQKDVEHFSSIYENAPMPYMQRLTWGGVALHAGQLPGYPASHGCIRLPHEFAKLLFDVTRVGMTVIVNRTDTLPRIAPEPYLSDEQPEDTGASYEWHPERAPEGPVSIVISGAERRAIVLRNGRVIGSARIGLAEPVLGTKIYMLQSQVGEERRWTRFDLSRGGRGEVAPPSTFGRFQAPLEFRKAVAAIIQPGTTVVVTADALEQPNVAVPLLEGE